MEDETKRTDLRQFRIPEDRLEEVLAAWDAAEPMVSGPFSVSHGSRLGNYRFFKLLESIVPEAKTIKPYHVHMMGSDEVYVREGDHDAWPHAQDMKKKAEAFINSLTGHGPGHPAPPEN